MEKSLSVGGCHEGRVVTAFRWACSEIRRTSCCLGRRPGPLEIERIARQVCTGDSEMDAMLEVTIKIYAVCHCSAQGIAR